MAKNFLSGNEAFAYGVRLARPQVISAYPITPQTIVVEKLSEFVEDGSLNAEFIHVESEHSALSCAMGASSVGARAFTATSSQGLLYMAECLRGRRQVPDRYDERQPFHRVALEHIRRPARLTLSA